MFDGSSTDLLPMSVSNQNCTIPTRKMLKLKSRERVFVNLSDSFEFHEILDKFFFLFLTLEGTRTESRWRKLDTQEPLADFTHHILLRPCHQIHTYSRLPPGTENKNFMLEREKHDHCTQQFSNSLRRCYCSQRLQNILRLQDTVKHSCCSSMK